MKKLKKKYWILIFISPILLIIILLTSIYFSNKLQNYLIRYALNQYQQSIPAQLSYKELKGNLFSHFTLNNIRISYSNKSLLTIKNLEIELDLMNLLKKEIKISTFQIDSLQVNLIIYADSSVNLKKAFTPLKKNIPSDKSKTTFPFDINLSQISINNSRVNILSYLDNYHLNQLIQNINIKTSFIYSKSNINLNLAFLNFDIDQYPIRFSKVLLIKTDQSLNSTIDQLNIGQSTLRIDLKHDFKENNSELNLLSKALNTKDLKHWYKSLPLSEHQYQLESQVIKINKKINLNLKLSDKNDYLHCNAKYNNLSKNELNAQIDFHNINLLSLLSDAKNSLQIKGILNVEMNSFDFLNNNLSITTDFQSLKYNDLILKNLNTNLQKDKNKLSINLQSIYKQAKYDAQIAVDNLFNTNKLTISKNIQYNGLISLNHLDISQFINHNTSDKSIKSNLNLALNVVGEGIDPINSDLKASIKIDSSSILFIPITQGEIEVDKKGSLINLNGTLYNNLENSLIIDAQYDIQSLINKSKFILNQLSANLILDLKNPSFLKDQLITYDLNDSLSQNSKINPMSKIELDQLLWTADLKCNVLNSQITINKSRYDSVMVDSLFCQINTKLDQNSKEFIQEPTELQAEFKHIKINSLYLDNVQLNAKKENDLLLSHLFVKQSDSLQVETSFTINNLNFSSIDISQFDLHLDKDDYTNLKGNVHIKNKDNLLEIKNFNLSKDSTDLSLNLSWDKKNKMLLNLDISQLNIMDIMVYLPSKTIKSAVIDFDLSYDNTSLKKKINSNLVVNNFTLNSIKLDTIFVNLKQIQDSLMIDSKILVANETVQIKGSLPIDLSLSAIKSNQIINKNKNFDLRILSQNIDLKPFNHPNNKITFSGQLNTKLTIHNKLNNIKTKGYFNIEKGQVEYPEYGMVIENFKTKINLLNDLVYIDTLSFTAGKGNMFAQGAINYEINHGLVIDSLHITSQSSKLHLLNSDMINTKIDSKLKLIGNSQNLSLTGDLTLLETHLDISKLTSKNYEDKLTVPLLVQALTPKPPIEDKEKQFNLPQFKKVDINCRVNIPRNTWISSQDFNIEITGSTQITKTDNLLTLDGNIDLLRGYYELYGKRFDIKSGSITFNKNKNLNPDLNIEAQFRFREGTDRRIIQLFVSGTLNKPVLSFLLDGNAIDEKDAVSYIIFGRNLKELTNKQQSTVSNQIDAQGMAAAYLLNKITGSINKKVNNYLNLDLLDITGSNQFGNTEVQVGKYLGDRIFISYLREFNFNNLSAVQNESINIEYQLSKRFYLTGNRNSLQSFGLDVIYKWEK